MRRTVVVTGIGGLGAFGSFWGNRTDLQEVLTLAAEGKIRHNVVTTKLDDINDSLEAQGRGDIVGRAVVMFD